MMRFFRAIIGGAVCLLAGTAAASPMDVETLRSSGFDGAITYEIEDDDQNPVPDANAQIHFDVYGEDGSTLFLKSDANGRVAAQAKVNLEAHACFGKTGYYKSWHDYMFFSCDETRHQDGRWRPWNPVFKIQLRRVIDPIEQKPTRFLLRNIATNALCNVSLLPHGRLSSGNTNDPPAFLFVWNHSPTAKKASGVRYSFVSTNEACGFQILQKVAGCSFPYVYEAPTNGYASRITFATEPHGEEERPPLDSATEYLVFRIPDDDSGFRYGIMKSCQVSIPSKDHMLLTIQFLLNKTENRRNLEFSMPWERP